MTEIVGVGAIAVVVLCVNGTGTGAGAGGVTVGGVTAGAAVLVALAFVVVVFVAAFLGVAVFVVGFAFAIAGLRAGCRGCVFCAERAWVRENVASAGGTCEVGSYGFSDSHSKTLRDLSSERCTFAKGDIQDVLVLSDLSVFFSLNS